MLLFVSMGADKGSGGLGGDPHLFIETFRQARKLSWCYEGKTDKRKGKVMVLKRKETCQILELSILMKADSSHHDQQ